MVTPEQQLEGIGKRLATIEARLIEFSALRNSNMESFPSMNWTLSKTDLIELIYALHSGGAFNKGACSIAEIARFFEHILNIQLGNTSMTFQEILRRKDSTAFLDRLKKKLEEHIDAIENAHIPQ